MSPPSPPNEHVDRHGILSAVGTMTRPQGGAKLSSSSTCQGNKRVTGTIMIGRERQKGSLRACGN